MRHGVAALIRRSNHGQQVRAGKDKLLVAGLFMIYEVLGPNSSQGIFTK